MERGMGCRVVAALVLALGGVVLLNQALRTQAMPAVRHCVGVGPLPLDDEDFCGCTWGEVLFRGEPVAGAAVMLTFGDGFTTTFTGLDVSDASLVFSTTAFHLGAQRGDVMTLTAYFAGQSVSRAFRAWPEADGEQYVPLALPELSWQPWITGGYTRALALDGDVLWAGGPAGLISVGLSSGVSVVHSLPWTTPAVRALALGNDGRVWAAGDGGVAEFDGSNWQTHTVPLSGAPRALAVNQTSGAVWLGGGDTGGSVAVYTGDWETAGTFGAPVMALALDDAGRAWSATYGDGVYRQDGNGDWDHYRTVDGLASDRVLAATASAGAVWFGTEPCYSTGSCGGISSYDLPTGTWQIYTTAHGLPSDTFFSQSPASVYALALGKDQVWAGTVDGLRLLLPDERWAAYTSTHGLRPGPVWAIAAGSETTIAAPVAGLDRLGPNATLGTPPTAQIVSAAPPTLTLGRTLVLNGSGFDGDEDGERIVSWDWSSDLDGPLCTQAACELPHALFAPGAHSITLRVQDDEGVWSDPATVQVVVERARYVYLPLVVRR